MPLYVILFPVMVWCDILCLTVIRCLMNNETEKQTLTTAPAIYHGSLMWLLAITVLAAGGVMSYMQIGDTYWLARSGCLVVMLGIWSGLGGLVWLTILNKRLAMRYRRSKRRLQFKFRDDPDELDAELLRLDKRFTELTDKHHSRLHLSVGVQEAVLLLAGTFFWGFGDLIRFVI